MFMKMFWRGYPKILGLLVAALSLPVFATESPWSRVVVIGASASSGFVLTEPFGGTNTAKCRLNNYLEAAITAPHEPVKNLAQAILFLSPDAVAAQEIEVATNSNPTLVLGVDFLFWFCYGPGRTDADRLQRFETGLKFLEQIRCPLVVGDIPDASFATNTGIISSAQVPSETARRAANERLKQWAAAHPQVTVMPLAEFMRAVSANQAVAVHGEILAAGKTRAWLQPDQLHPTPRGAAVLTLKMLDAFAQARPEISVQDIRWDVTGVLRDGLKRAE